MDEDGIGLSAITGRCGQVARRFFWIANSAGSRMGLHEVEVGEIVVIRGS